MIDSSTTRAILTQDHRVLIEQPDGSYRFADDRTDWERLDTMTDEEIEEAVKNDPDAAPIMDEKWWSQARATAKKQITIQLDKDILDWLQSQGAGYQTRINAILRQYKETQQNR